jgi:hypothetical protein
MKHIISSTKKVFSDFLYLFLGVSLTVNLLFVYYFVFLQTTTFEVFFASNNAFYNWSSIILTITNSILFGIAVAMMIFVWKANRAAARYGSGSSFFGAAFGAISTGCPVCGAWLLPILGITGSLAAFPLQGLEIKILSIALLLFAIWEASKSIAGICPVHKQKLLSWNKTHFVLNLNKTTLPQLKPVLFIGLSILVVYLLPKLPAKYKLSFANKNNLIANTNPINTSSNIDSSTLFTQVNPPEGYTVSATFGDLGPKLLSSGAIDLEKFKQTYERAGAPLTNSQLKILTEGSNEKITINKDSAYFLINFLWALGLANKNPILDEGQMTKYGKGQIGSFASTGGWTIGKKPSTEIYSKSRIVKLDTDQQARVERAANGTYRPCCGNSTAFPDCNHGMAMLGLFELMASQGATTNELFEAGKYFNAFWFPQQYLDLATYFKVKEGKDFKKIDPKLIVSEKFSSGGGWSNTKKWLANNNLIEKAPSGGGGCGV